MDENRFWSIIDAAWLTIDSKDAARQKLYAGEMSDRDEDNLVNTLEKVVPEIEKQLDTLSAEDLQNFDRILERKLYDIDRADVQECTGGSDDGFLYARGFIVAAGRQYYESINEDPSLATMDLRAEVMCYLSWHLYEKKFGKMPPSEISRESCSNEPGWP